MSIIAQIESSITENTSEAFRNVSRNGKGRKKAQGFDLGTMLFWHTTNANGF